MKRIIALILACVILIGCSATNNKLESDNTTQAQTTKSEEDLIEFESLSDTELLSYIEDNVYSELVSGLNSEKYLVENISSVYISKEYLEEVAYNTQENIFFGFTLAEVEAAFEGKRYVFTLGDDGKTTVTEFVEYVDPFQQILKNVAIGTGVILLSITVSLVTANSAPAVSIIFAVSAKNGTIAALSSATLGGLSAGIVEGIKTGDFDKALNEAMLQGSEGFKWGAIVGSVKGIVDGIRIVKNTHFFPDGSIQAQKYPQGVEFTKATDGNKYPRFEKWAKATAKFDAPNRTTALNHTGLSGDYYWDAKLANAQCGYAQTPAGYVWHHVEDMKTMILIPQDIHSVYFGGMPHKGGASLIREMLDLVG